MTEKLYQCFNKARNTTKKYSNPTEKCAKIINVKYECQFTKTKDVSHKHKQNQP